MTLISHSKAVVPLQGSVCTDVIWSR